MKKTKQTLGKRNFLRTVLDEVLRDKCLEEVKASKLWLRMTVGFEKAVDKTV